MADKPQERDTQFADSVDGSRSGLVGEFIGFLKHNKKWWLAPIIIMIVLLGLMVLLGGTAAGPFVYTLF